MVDREAREAYVHPPRPPSCDLVDDGHLEPGPHPEWPFHHPSHPLLEWTLRVDPSDLGCPGGPARRVSVCGPHRRRARRPSNFDALAHISEPTPGLIKPLRPQPGYTNACRSGASPTTHSERRSTLGALQWPSIRSIARSDRRRPLQRSSELSGASVLRTPLRGMFPELSHHTVSGASGGLPTG